MPNRNLERIREIEPQEMNLVLNEVKSCGLKMIRYGSDTKYPTKAHAIKSKEYSSLSWCYLISETLTRLEVTTTYYTNDREPKMYPITWVCSLNEKKAIERTGQVAYMQFQRAAKIPSAKQLGIDKLLAESNISGKYLYSAVPMLGSKSHEIRQYNNIYEYDRNSAYSSVLLSKMPSFAYLDRDREVREGEIGWLLTENLALCHVGEFANFISPLSDTPEAVLNYIKKWYNLKQRGNAEAKAMLNFPIGYYQRTNPLFRAYVVNSCNDIIRELLDEHVVLWNTDAVYSDVELPLKVGSAIGEWKKTKIEKFTLLGTNYQINNEHPSYRGIPKQWFEAFKNINGRPFDLTKDKLPGRVNKWFMNWEKLKLEEI